MNKKILVSGILLVVAVLVFACLPKANNSTAGTEEKVTEKQGTETTGTGIKFIEEDWTKALAKAKKEKKLIFLDAYTTWCGPCKMLKRNTFPDKAVGEFFNKNFVNVELDMEKGEGLAVAAKFGVNAYPTLLFADAEGNMVTFTQGYMEAKQLLEFGNYGLSKVKK